MEIIILGAALAFNLLVIKYKFEAKRTEDASLDLGMLVLIAIFFSGSYPALVMGTVASAIISIYLYFYPPQFLKDEQKIDIPDITDTQNTANRTWR